MVKIRNNTVFLILCFFLIITLSGCNTFQQPEENVPANNNQTSQYEVVVYFSDSQAEYLIPENRAVEIDRDASSQQLAEEIISELIAGPNDSTLSPTIPTGTELLSIVIDNKTALVDFSEELKTNHWGGSAGETMTITSIVNSLTELDDIDKVQILVEGEEQESLAGHWDISEPLKRDPNIIRN